jgi:hypothetical protein
MNKYLARLRAKKSLDTYQPAVAKVSKDHFATFATSLPTGNETFSGAVSQPAMPEQAQANRQAMPEIARVVDDLRRVFGSTVRVAYAKENGRQVGTSRPVDAAAPATLEPALQTESAPTPTTVCCAACLHSVLGADTDPVYGWRLCGLHLERGGGFGQAQRPCKSWEAGSTINPPVDVEPLLPLLCHWNNMGRLVTKCSNPHPNADGTGCGNCGEGKP